MTQYNHDPKKVTLIFNGVAIEGFQEGTGVMLEPDSDVSTTSMGVDSGFTRNINTNISWTLTFTLQNGSPSNTFINSLIRSGLPIAFLVKDANTLNTQATGLCYVQGMPSIGGELEAQGREYTFTGANVNINYGGAIE